ncbi:MAG: YolD-like family protein [Muribaculaceae bacterium]|nr:YolD-like family protein [Muribaculaceae bacterium]
MGNYDDIINLPHHEPVSHPRMPASDRAAQFSPFAALTGHEAAIAETSRLTDEKPELDEDKKEELDAQLQILRAHIALEPKAAITYFVPDSKKDGGSYRKASGNLKKLDDSKHQIIMKNGTVIAMDDIYAIESPIFEDIID